MSAAVAEAIEEEVTATGPDGDAPEAAERAEPEDFADQPQDEAPAETEPEATGSAPAAAKPGAEPAEHVADDATDSHEDDVLEEAAPVPTTGEVAVPVPPSDALARAIGATAGTRLGLSQDATRMLGALLVLAVTDLGRGCPWERVT